MIDSKLVVDNVEFFSRECYSLEGVSSILSRISDLTHNGVHITGIAEHLLDAMAQVHEDGAEIYMEQRAYEPSTYHNLMNNNLEGYTRLETIRELLLDGLLSLPDAPLQLHWNYMNDTEELL